MGHTVTLIPAPGNENGDHEKSEDDSDINIEEARDKTENQNLLKWCIMFKMFIWPSLLAIVTFNMTLTYLLFFPISLQWL